MQKQLKPGVSAADGAPARNITASSLFRPLTEAEPQQTSIQTALFTTVCHEQDCSYVSEWMESESKWWKELWSAVAQLIIIAFFFKYMNHGSLDARRD